MKTLINNGADINIQDHKGMTALMYAAVNGRDTDYLELLRLNGADLFLKNKNGKNARDLFQE